MRHWPRAFLSSILFLPAAALASGDAAPAQVQKIETHWRVTVIRSQKAGESIDKLEFSSGTFPVEVIVTGNKYQAQANLEGALQLDEWNLLWGDQVLVKFPPKNPAFKMTVPFTQEMVPVDLTAVSPTGDLKTEKIILHFKDWKTYDEEVKAGTFLQRASARKRHFVSPSLGVTLLTYTQTKLDAYSAVMMTLKAAYQFTISDWIDVGTSAYFNALPITTSADGIAARFLGVNLRAGFALPWIKDPLRLSFLVGGYYVTSFVTDDAFGFKNMMGPQIFPNFRYRFTGGSSLYGYFKFSPVANGLGVLGLSSNEIATGGGFVWLMKNNHPLSFMVDYSKLSLVLEKAQALGTSTTFSVGYGF